MAQVAGKSFVKSLYDFSFSNLVTIKVIRSLYIVVTVLYSLAAIGAFVVFIAQGGLGILIAIVFVPLLYLVYLTIARIVMEMFLVVFRMGDDVRMIRDQRTLGGTPRPPTP